MQRDTQNYDWSLSTPFKFSLVTKKKRKKEVISSTYATHRNVHTNECSKPLKRSQEEKENVLLFQNRNMKYYYFVHCYRHPTVHKWSNNPKSSKKKNMREKEIKDAKLNKIAPFWSCWLLLCVFHCIHFIVVRIVCGWLEMSMDFDGHSCSISNDNREPEARRGDQKDGSFSWRLNGMCLCVTP